LLARWLRSNWSLNHLSVESSEVEAEEAEEVTRSNPNETSETVPAMLSTNYQIQSLRIVGTEIQVNAVILQVLDAVATLDSFISLTLAPSSIGMVENTFSGLQVLKVPSMDFVMLGLWHSRRK
jgi:hypothetical protein